MPGNHDRKRISGPSIDSKRHGVSHLLPPSSGLAALGLSRELRTRTGQEPVTHVTAGTGRTQTRSYVPGISQTSSRTSLTACDLVSQSGPTRTGCATSTSATWACSSAPVPSKEASRRSPSSARNNPACTGPSTARPTYSPCAASVPAAGGTTSSRPPLPARTGATRRRLTDTATQNRKAHDPVKIIPNKAVAHPRVCPALRNCPHPGLPWNPATLAPEGTMKDGPSDCKPSL